jgi:putative endonuclease
MRVQDAVGKYGEALAAGRLAADGLVVLDTNWRCREGEIDLVARAGDALVVVEVKTRSGAGYGGAAGAVTPAKQRRLRRLAVRWLADHPGTGWESIRFDVVTVVRGCGAVDVQHLRGAF